MFPLNHRANLLLAVNFRLSAWAAWGPPSLEVFFIVIQETRRKLRPSNRRATRSKDASSLLVAPGLTTRNKNLLGAKGIATSSKTGATGPTPSRLFFLNSPMVIYVDLIFEQNISKSVLERSKSSRSKKPVLLGCSHTMPYPL